MRLDHVAHVRITAQVIMSRTALRGLAGIREHQKPAALRDDDDLSDIGVGKIDFARSSECLVRLV